MYYEKVEGTELTCMDHCFQRQISHSVSHVSLSRYSEQK